ncbi:dor1-like family protein [Grosmannia clavigera kw1407]|uniref:Conserved oligomeric Golgi complex subunit 8 n=1 Tax=Grosmannia clavigera (strain kw1407 / UAMH 11150) TaxID=655863 RepID=F0XMI7_GROCL|nr:dor1-like family protein [Grosmannia clavigera kw1407]EFX01021.1 dor1-like family protein [Grosmannia clavigera kw1407]
MADLLYDLLVPSPSPGIVSPPDPDALAYLGSLAARPLASLRADEPPALAQASQSLLLSLQALARRSCEPVLASERHHAAFCGGLPTLAAHTAELRAALPLLDGASLRFASYRTGETNGRRRQALLLARNAERLLDVLDLPPLLAAATGSTAAPSSLTTTTASSAGAAAHYNYAAALDLNGHIRRLHALYPHSALVQSVAAAADEAMRAAAASLVLSLQAPGLKLAASLRTVSWLRRVLPDLEATASTMTTNTTIAATTTTSTPAQERTLGAVFLVCRLATLTSMLDALAPLRELADQERARLAASSPPLASSTGSRAWSGGQQTERYLKRYVEIFREQSFAIVSMFRSIFPDAEIDGIGQTGDMNESEKENDTDTPLHPHDPLEPLPPALAGFPLHLVDLLLATLRRYLPTVRDQAARDSLLTQVLYCAGSLGRLGADFGLFLATLDVGHSAEDEWVEIVRRHRQLAGRLESIVGDGKKR